MTSAPEHPFRVLHVDDCAADREAVRRHLSSSDFALRQPETLAELEQALAEARYDLVLCELSPWGSESWSVLEQVAAGYQRLDASAVVILTGRGSETLAAASIKRGAADYWPKSSGYDATLGEQIKAAWSAEETRRAGERQRDRLFRQSLNLLCVGGFDGFIKHWNPAWQDLLGYSREEMMSLPLATLVHPDDFMLGAKVGAQLLSGKSIHPIEIRIMRRDGSYRWLLWYAVSCPEEQVYFATGQDITAQKEVEEQLRESQERFQLIASATNEAVWDWDLRTNRVWRNQCYFDTFGRPDDEREGTIEWWYQRLHPDDRDRIMTCLPPPLVDGQQKWVMEYRLRRIDGEYAHVYDRGFVIFGADGKPVRMVGSVMDISELKNAEIRLRESEERFRLAARAASDAIWDVDLRTGAVWRSEGFQTLFGYSSDELKDGLNWWYSRIHEDDLQRVLKLFSAATTSGSSQCSFEYRFRRADGSYADVFDRGFVMRDADGNPTRLVGSVMDMSERRRAEEVATMQRAELAHMARISTMGEIATGLAHELNQPLTAINNYAESCTRAIGSQLPGRDEKLMQWIERIAANSHRAAEMIRRLRGFSRKEAPQRSTIEVAELIREVLDLLETETRLQSVRVRWEPPADIHATVDRIQIQQVLVNLLRNAYESMAASSPERRQVTITATQQQERVEIAVSDLGEGISPEARDRVFDAFYTSKANGMGIGLAISRSIVESHGGRLWYTPNPTQGVTFHFTLPVSSPAVSYRPPAGANNGHLAVPLTSVVDDA